MPGCPGAARFLLLFAGSIHGQQGALVLVIDDLGDKLRSGQRALALASNITYAVLPHTPFGRRLANCAIAHP